MVKAAVDKGDHQVLEDARRVGQYAAGEAVAPTSQVTYEAVREHSVCSTPARLCQM
jgi:hypothetical protein